MTDCIFCRIVRGDRPAHTVYEDEHSLAFLDIHPLTDGHTLVIPKVHYMTLEDMPIMEVGKLFETVHRVSKAIKEALEAPALTIGINDGRLAGQVVPHLHIHIVPRYPGDGGGTIHSIVRGPIKLSLEEARQRIASVL